MGIHLTLILSFILIQLNAQNNFCFVPAVNSHVFSGTIARKICYGDLNNDQHADFACSLWNSSFDVILSNGSGGYFNPVNHMFSSSFYSTVELNITDVNADGNQDLIHADSSALALKIYVGNGTGNFTGTLTVNSGPNPWRFVAKDFNIDGSPDLAIIRRQSTTIGVFLNNGTGAFSSVQTLTCSAIPEDILFEDMDNDGKGDLVVTTKNPVTLNIFKSNGNGTFNLLTANPFFSQFDVTKAGDFNNDGNIDLVSISDHTLVTLYVGNGNGSFTSQSTFTTQFTNDLCLADLNGDNVKDLAVLGSKPNDIYLFQGGGTSNLNTPTVLNSVLTSTMCQSTIAHFCIKSFDINNDGRNDLIIGVDNCVYIRILENCLPASVNKVDRSVSFAFPNPATNNVRISQFAEGFYFIYDSMGSLMLWGKVSSEDINLEKLPVGFYTLFLKTSCEVIKQKLILNK